MDEHAYREAVDSAAIFSETDLSGTITYVNPKFCEISGYAPSELLGQNRLWKVRYVVRPDLYPTARKATR